MSSSVAHDDVSSPSLQESIEEALASDRHQAIQSTEEVESDRNASNAAPNERISNNPSSTIMYSPSKTIHLLSLVQAYNDIYSQCIQELYRAMLWNLTKARRAVQSRHAPTVTHPMITASSMHRSLIAQRRLFYDDDETREVVLDVCDEHGGRQSDMPPSLTEEEEASPWKTDDDPSTTTTGLRQRKAASDSVPRATSMKKEERPMDPATGPAPDPLQLLLWCSNAWQTAIPASLPQAQENAIRWMECACLLSQIQVAIMKIINDS